MKKHLIEQRVKNKFQKSRETFPRFLLGGSINACIVIITMATFEGIMQNPYITNISGYIAGIAIGFFIHSKYTFRATISLRNSFVYTLIMISGYLINLLALSKIITITSTALAQLSAITIYICYSFIMQSVFLTQQAK